MSTPISRNNKLQGAALYAPPRVRERAFREERSEFAEAPAQDEAARSEDGQPELAQPGTIENEENGNEADGTDALDRLDEAIRAVVELEHPSDTRLVFHRAFAGSQSPPTAPAQQEGDDVPPTTAEARRVNRGDDAPVRPRRARLEPEIVPEPVPVMRESGHFQQFLRFAVVIAFAAMAAYGLTMFSASGPGGLWLKGASRRIANVSRPQEMPAPSPPRSRLVVENQQAFANEPISLAVNVEHAADNESLLFEGLVQGTTLSAGQSTSPFSWRLPSDELHGLYLYAPKGFVGIMNTTINLLGSDNRLLDSHAMQLKWVAKQPQPVSAPALATATADAAAGDRIGTAKPTMPAVEPIDPGVAAILLQKGRDSLDAGDISGARVAFRRLADAGMPDAALALARTYDPEYLAAHNFLGVHGDPATARALYQRAKELGSAEAGQILARMVAN
jgi:hypothetical protein